jgi:hypothetical protein
MNVKRQGKTLAGAGMKNSQVRAINAYYKSRKQTIADAENTARKTVPTTRFLGDSARN